MENRMLRHKAVMQCARIAFGFSGIHDEDDGQVIGERPAKGRVIARSEPLDPFAAPKLNAIPVDSDWANDEGGIE